MAKPTNVIPQAGNDRTARRMRSAVRHECRNAVLKAWMDDTDAELRMALREGRYSSVTGGPIDDDRDYATEVSKLR